MSSVARCASSAEFFSMSASVLRCSTTNSSICRPIASACSAMIAEIIVFNSNAAITISLKERK